MIELCVPISKVVRINCYVKYYSDKHEENAMHLNRFKLCHMLLQLIRMQHCIRSNFVMFILVVKLIVTHSVQKSEIRSPFYKKWKKQLNFLSTFGTTHFEFVNNTIIIIVNWLQLENCAKKTSPKLLWARKGKKIFIQLIVML